jgi:hypothetical protein
MPKTYTVTVDSPSWMVEAQRKYTGLTKDEMADRVVSAQPALTQPVEVKVYHYPPRTSFFCYPLNGDEPLIIVVIEE